MRTLHDSKLKKGQSHNWRILIHHYNIITPFHRPCIALKFIILSAPQITLEKKINHLFTSSWIFFSFSFCRELETGFDLLPSKLMYNPPSSFILRPGSIRLDNSFLKLISMGGKKIPQEQQSRLIFHLCTVVIKHSNVSTVQLCLHALIKPKNELIQSHLCYRYADVLKLLTHTSFLIINMGNSSIEFIVTLFRLASQAFSSNTSDLTNVLLEEWSKIPINIFLNLVHHSTKMITRKQFVLIAGTIPFEVTGGPKPLVTSNCRGQRLRSFLHSVT